MSQKENKESQLEIIDKYTDNFLKTLLNIKVNNDAILQNGYRDDNDDNDLDNDLDGDHNNDDASVSTGSTISDITPHVFKDTIGKIFPSFKEKDYKLIKQKVDKLSELINNINKTKKEILEQKGTLGEEEKKSDDEEILKEEENLKKEIKKLIITILQLNNESNIIDAYEPLFTKNLIVSTDIKDSEYILDIQDDSKKVIGISGVLNKDFIGKLKYLDEFIQLKDKKEANVKNIIAEVGNKSIKELETLLKQQNEAKAAIRIQKKFRGVKGKIEAKEAKKQTEAATKIQSLNRGFKGRKQAKNVAAERSVGGRRTFKRKRKTRINKKNKRKTNKSKQNKK